MIRDANMMLQNQLKQHTALERKGFKLNCNWKKIASIKRNSFALSFMYISVILQHTCKINRLCMLYEYCFASFCQTIIYTFFIDTLQLYPYLAVLHLNRDLCYTLI